MNNRFLARSFKSY